MRGQWKTSASQPHGKPRARIAHAAPHGVPNIGPSLIENILWAGLGWGWTRARDLFVCAVQGELWWWRARGGSPSCDWWGGCEFILGGIRFSLWGLFSFRETGPKRTFRMFSFFVGSLGIRTRLGNRSVWKLARSLARIFTQIDRRGSSTSWNHYRDHISDLIYPYDDIFCF